MAALAIKTMFISLLALSHGVFADWRLDHNANENMKPYVRVERDTNEAGMITTRVTDNHKWGDFSYLVMMHDSKDYLKYYIYYIVKNNLIVQEVNNDVLRTVISGKTPCEFAVVESSGDTVFFSLDPKKKPDELPDAEAGRDFLNSKKSAKYGYEIILSNRWHASCRFWR
jgi:hypothetical protein